jgi:hypothetical protein
MTFRRLLLAAITSTAIAASVFGTQTATAGAFFYSGNWYTYPGYVIQPPHYVYTEYGMDKTQACSVLGNYPPENGMWPACWYGVNGPQNYVCVTLINQWWELEVPWECGWGIVGRYLGGIYGWPLMASTIPYQEAQFYQLTDWPG